MRLTSTLFLLGLTATTLHAQRYLGISTSNWSSTNQAYLNPANLADSRHRFTIDLASVNFGVDNNGGTLKASGAFDRFYSGDTSKGLDKVFRFNDDKNFNLMAPHAEVRGPGFMYSINPKHTIALTTRVRAFNQLTDFDQKLYRTIADEAYASANGDYAIQADRFNWNAHVWSEVGVSYGGVLYDNGKHALKGGITLRYLAGIGYINLNADNLDGRYVASSDSVYITNTNFTFASNIVDDEEELSSSLTGSKIVDYFFGSKGGRGIGGDLGFVYEFRPDFMKYRYDMDGKNNLDDYSRNRYKLRLSAAVTDVGSIRYRKSNKQIRVSGNGAFDGNELVDRIDNFTEFQNYLRQGGVTLEDTGETTTRLRLPTAIVLSADYNIHNNIYANLTYAGNVVNQYAAGNYYYSQITITPRYDKRAYSIGVPISYSFVTKKMKLGIGARFGGFFFGSDDALAFTGSDKQNGVNFYMGGFVPINKRRPRDSDKDKVSDKLDKCPTVAGIWEMRGCPNPDKDGDGIVDTEDMCPDVAGSPTAMGCPDADLDSVADASDACPDAAGPVALNGCPDRDGDGIADKLDTCPDVAGEARFQGCPDTDRDGVPDNKDQCPDKAGPVAQKGCPDTDHDGIIDSEDRCPTMAGTKENGGCPEIKAEVQRRLAFAATAIQFETGKATIKKQSFTQLDEVVRILNEYADYYMTIDGHTDNVGKPEMNLQLSKDRAESIKVYSMDKGIAADRLVTNGYGDTQPIASNKTAAGRTKNRRVTLNLKYKE